MNHADYLALLINEIGELRKQRDEINVRIARTTRLIEATGDMIPDSDIQAGFRGALERFVDRLHSENIGLTEAVRAALRSQPEKSFTPAMLRESLEHNGVIFRGYRSNPSISINSVLKRLDEGEVKVTRLADGAMFYQWKMLGNQRVFELMSKEEETGG